MKLFKLLMNAVRQLIIALAVAVMIALTVITINLRLPPNFAQNLALPPVVRAANSTPVRVQVDDERLWGRIGQRGDRQALLKAIDYSLRYLRTRRAAAAYRRQYRVTGVTLSRVRHSLLRFRYLLRTARSPAELQRAVKREFELYRPRGGSTPGSTEGSTPQPVQFTGYYEPVFAASPVPDRIYRYPLYRRPPRLSRWPRPHPTRAALEGVDGLQRAQRLRGLELVWLRDRLEAYLVQVQGCARLKLTDGRTISIGYDSNTAWPYTSIGRELVKDGKIRFEQLTLPAVIKHFRSAPQELKSYLPRNRRFIFFRKTHGAPVRGSIGVPLTAERSIATDKSLMPPGALALIQIEISNPEAAHVLKSRTITRYVLDQDTGVAIKGAHRVDVFMGTGRWAGARAGVINSTGQLYYLLLKQGGVMRRAK